jgi:hypothetical protein
MNSMGSSESTVLQPSGTVALKLRAAFPPPAYTVEVSKPASNMPIQKRDFMLIDLLLI